MTEQPGPAYCPFTGGDPEGCDLKDAMITAHHLAWHATDILIPALEALRRVKDPPLGPPLTHFFHCWRFPAHHACAVALIERQAQEHDMLLAQQRIIP